MAAIGAPRISRYLGRKRFQRFSPRASRNIATETATMLRSSPGAALTRARAESTVIIPMLLHEHPFRPEQGEGDEADDGGSRDQQRARVRRARRSRGGPGAGSRGRAGESGRAPLRGRCPWPPFGLVGDVTLDRECSNRYIAIMRWLMLLATLPPTPTRHRVGVWRKLQRMGAVRLRGSAWILPETAETTELFQWLVQEIETVHGEATLVHVERIEDMTDEQGRPPVPQARTRPRPHIDRIASAWLIKRFCDPDAKFGFADAADAARKGVPFDVLGADFGHHGEDCTFETLVKRFGIKDRRVRVIAEVVHEADLHDGKFSRSEAMGVDLAIRGLAASTSDDHELLERGMAIFDGLYAVLKRTS